MLLLQREIKWKMIIPHYRIKMKFVQSLLNQFALIIRKNILFLYIKRLVSSHSCTDMLYHLLFPLLSVCTYNSCVEINEKFPFADYQWIPLGLNKVACLMQAINSGDTRKRLKAKDPDCEIPFNKVINDHPIPSFKQ